MTSSTLNSESAEPRWGLVWAVAILLVAVVVGSWELLVREAGLGPAYVDNKTLWADTRHRLNKHGQDAIVLLGASRLQRAVDAGALSSQFERPVFQLSVEGSSYLAVLENLAVDPRIRGTVVVSLAPAFTYNRLLTQFDNGRQARYVRHYIRQSLARRIEQRLTLFLQGHIAFRAPRARPSMVASSIIETGELPGPGRQSVFRSRVVHMDYDLMPVKQTDDWMVEHYRRNVEPYSRTEFDPIVNYIDTIVGMLRQKGADVYFVRLPSAGAVRKLEEELFPRDEFWGVLEKNIDATFVHFADYPELTGFMSEDGSHVDSAQILEFTDRLGKVLIRNQLQRGTE